MIWFIFGMMFAFFNSVTMLVNQKFQINGHLISGVRGVGVAALFLPATFFLTPPKSSLFWGLIVLQGMMSSFFNARLYSSSAKFGAGATSRISALAVVFGLGAWWIVDYQRLVELWDSPPVFAGILVSLAVVVVSFFFMSQSKSSASMAEMKYMLPAVVLLAFMMIVRKEIMESSAFLSAIVYYCVLSIAMSGAWNLIYYARENTLKGLVSQLKTRRIAIGCISMVFASAVTIICGNIGVFYAPNPAYVNALTLTSPIFVMIFNKTTGVKDPVSIPAMVIMLLGIAALLYFSEIPLPHPNI